MLSSKVSGPSSLTGTWPCGRASSIYHWAAYDQIRYCAWGLLGGDGDGGRRRACYGLALWRPIGAGHGQGQRSPSALIRTRPRLGDADGETTWVFPTWLTRPLWMIVGTKLACLIGCRRATIHVLQMAAVPSQRQSGSPSIHRLSPLISIPSARSLAMRRDSCIFIDLRSIAF